MRRCAGAAGMGAHAGGMQELPEDDSDLPAPSFTGFGRRARSLMSEEGRYTFDQLMSVTEDFGVVGERHVKVFAGRGTHNNFAIPGQHPSPRERVHLRLGLRRQRHRPAFGRAGGREVPQAPARAAGVAEDPAGHIAGGAASARGRRGRLRPGGDAARYAGVRLRAGHRGCATVRGAGADHRARGDARRPGVAAGGGVADRRRRPRRWTDLVAADARAGRRLSRRMGRSLRRRSLRRAQRHAFSRCPRQADRVARASVGESSNCRQCWRARSSAAASRQRSRTSDIVAVDFALGLSTTGLRLAPALLRDDRLHL